MYHQYTLLSCSEHVSTNRRVTWSIQYVYKHVVCVYVVLFLQVVHYELKHKGMLPMIPVAMFFLVCKLPICLSMRWAAH